MLSNLSTMVSFSALENPNTSRNQNHASQKAPRFLLARSRNLAEFDIYVLPKKPNGKHESMNGNLAKWLEQLKALAV